MTKHRTILRITKVGKLSVSSIVPGWNSSRNVPIPIADFPEALRPHLKEGAHFFAQAHLDADGPTRVRPSDFELAPEPDPNDGLAPLPPRTFSFTLEEIGRIIDYAFQAGRKQESHIAVKAKLLQQVVAMKESQRETAMGGTKEPTDRSAD